VCIVLGVAATLGCTHVGTPVAQETTPVAAVNPFFAPYGTPYDVPPFDRLAPEHFVPAFEEGMRRQLEEIDAIVTNPEEPTYANTIAALDCSGQLLGEVLRVFYGLSSANTNELLQAVDEEMSPRLAAHRDEILLNAPLFDRIKQVYERRNELDLTAEQQFLLEHLYGDYVRNGALLGEADQAKLRELNTKLSSLRVLFRKNLLAETNAFKLVIDDEADLAGLPASVIETAAAAANAAGVDGSWVFTTHKPSMLPFLTYAENRELRRQLYAAYTSRGDNDNEHDNKQAMADIIKLRIEQARLLGYDSPAQLVLERRMAKTPERVYELLDRLWEAALPVAKHEVAEMQEIIDSEGGGFKLASWDWWYYAEKLRKQSYDLDDAELRPYFVLANVRDGMFEVAHRLYGLSFNEITDIPRPHPDAQTFRVTEADGTHCAILYLDYHPRASKRQGAWCGRYRSQSWQEGTQVDPIVTMVTNVSEPSGSAPALLSLEEVSTLFHEFGHALDGMLSNVTSHRLYTSGDFSELPSQIMEHWALEPEVLQIYARHYQSGEVIPEELVAKIRNSEHFNQGFATVEYLAASLLDMAYHTQTEVRDLDVVDFENELFAKIGLIPEIVSRYRSTYFAHIIGGYQAGYYGYIWAGVLDNDAFEAFKENGLFDRETAQRFRTEVLEVNGTRDFDEMYRAFRGRDPEIEPLLRNRGLL